jgi:choice-of-anchor C domain-containing protein
MSTKLPVVLLFLGILVISPFYTPLASANPNLVTNGSFEAPICPPNTNWVTLLAGSLAMNGWTIGPDSIDHMCAFWQATDGTRSVDLSGNNAGRISQSFPTVSGQTYDVSFDMAGNMSCGNVVKLMTVNAPGYTNQFAFDTTGKTFTNMGYQTKTFSFVATASTSQIQFVSNENNACGPVLDNVYVQLAAPSPPPPTLFGMNLPTSSPFLSCTQGQFELNNKPHVWYINPDASGSLDIDIRAVAVNPAETGSIIANLFDGFTPIGSVTVPHPPTGENVGFITIPSAVSTKVYRLEITLGAPLPNTQQAHHYKISLAGVPADIGIITPGFSYNEHNPGEKFFVIVGPNAPYSISLFLDNPMNGANPATTITYEIPGVIPPTTQPISAASPITITGFNGPLQQILTLIVNADGHYRIATGGLADTGIYFETCTPKPQVCNDNNPCTTDTLSPDDVCVFTPVNVDDNNACTDDFCDPANGNITHTPIPVDDGDACTGDFCDPATGNVINQPVDCNDGFACSLDTCDPAIGCVHTPIDPDDGNACTADSCDPTTGVSNTPISCDDNNVCTADSCDPASGCVSAAVPTDDGNACTTDSCDPTTGVSNIPISCDDNNVCTTDACDPASGCVSAAVPTDDGNACTTDSCDPTTGVSNTPISCDDSNACTADSCDPASGCVSAAVPTDDGNACTTDSCDPTTGVSNIPISCDDNNVCTADSCDPATGCTSNNLPDGTSCGTDLVCNSGQCIPAPNENAGRMTGGGSVTTGQTRVTHGFELHCDETTMPNRLEVNWGGNRFHMEQLNSATCSDSTTIDEGQPVAGFDTYQGTGTGRYNGVSGATIEFTFTDEGEPGRVDRVVSLVIRDVNNNVVLTTSGNLNSGNQQAHPE